MKPTCSQRVISEEQDIPSTKRFGFVHTYDPKPRRKLWELLKSHGINTLIITGVNTNSCVLSTVTAACSLDYAVIVPEDCVDTMDAPALHDAALLCIRTAFGFVMPSEAVMALPELKQSEGGSR